MAYYTFYDEYKTLDASCIWEELVEYVEENKSFRSLVRHHIYKANVEDDLLHYIPHINNTENPHYPISSISKDGVMKALNKIRLLNTINSNTVRPYLRLASFPINQCLPFLGLLISAEILKMS